MEQRNGICSICLAWARKEHWKGIYSNWLAWARKEHRMEIRSNGPSINSERARNGNILKWTMHELKNGTKSEYAPSFSSRKHKWEYVSMSFRSEREPCRICSNRSYFNLEEHRMRISSNGQAERGPNVVCSSKPYFNIEELEGKYAQWIRPMFYSVLTETLHEDWLN